MDGACIGPEGWNGYPEVAVTVDADGVVYGVWVSTDRLPYLVWSRDGGATWSDPVAVGAPGVTEDEPRGRRGRGGRAASRSVPWSALTRQPA